MSFHQFVELPVEVLNLILLRCEVPDICRISNTCRRLHVIAKSEYVWYFKWMELSTKCGLFFPGDNLTDPSSSPETTYFSRCKRLWRMLCKKSESLVNFPTCEKCGKKTCSPECQIVSERKIALDIGSKTTWTLTTTYALKRHPTILMRSRNSATSASSEGDQPNESKNMIFCGVCKVGKPQPCGTTFQPPLDPCSSVPYAFIPSEDFLSSLDQRDERTSKSMASNAERLSSPEHSRRTMSNFDAYSTPLASDSPLWSDLKLYFKSLHGNFQMVSPLDCYTLGQNFEVLMLYIQHILYKCQMAEKIQNPNVSLLICEPHNSTSCSRRALAKYLFEELLVSRLCFLNKAYSVAKLLDFETCIVIDSGAHNTVVSLIIQGEVQEAYTRHRPVGGLTISEYLATALKCNGILDNVSLANLESRAVKSSCYLSYNITVEERRKAPIRRYINVRWTNGAESTADQIKKCELGAELYLAPEVMYAAMELPSIIKEVIDSLDAPLAKDVLMHVLLTGSNTELNGFATRLIRDLQLCLPDFKHVINVHTYVGSHSWDAALGATRIPSPESTVPCIMQSDAWIPGSLMWITREDYILFGTSHL